MTLRKFIRDNRQEIDRVIAAELKGQDFRHNDEERRLWVLNFEPLYRWARSYGVQV
jgi:hypothetical protein